VVRLLLCYVACFAIEEGNELQTLSRIFCWYSLYELWFGHVRPNPYEEEQGGDWRKCSLIPTVNNELCMTELKRISSYRTLLLGTVTGNMSQDELLTASDWITLSEYLYVAVCSNFRPSTVEGASTHWKSFTPQTSWSPALVLWDMQCSFIVI
jgi:hypothetical protein